MNLPKQEQPALRHLGPYLAMMRPYLFLLSVGLILNLMAVASSIGLVGLSSWFLNASALAGTAVASSLAFNYMLPSAGVRLFATSRTITRYGERVTTHQATFKILSRLRKQVYLAIEPLSPAALQHLGSADISTRLTADVDALDALYVRVLVPSIVALLAIVGVGIVLGMFAPQIGFFAMVTLGLAGALGPLMALKRGKRYSDEWQQWDTRLRTRFTERMDSFAELSLYGQWPTEQQALLAGEQQRDRAELTLARQWGDAQLLSMLLLGLSVTGGMLLAAYWEAHYGLDATLVATIGLTLLAAFEAVMMLPQAWQEMGKVIRAATRLDQLRQSVPDIRFKQTSSSLPNHYGIEARDIAVNLEGNQVLEKLHLDIPEQQHLALLGHSGAGKTTFLNLLVRFLDPDQGSITLGGVDIREIAEDDLRRLFTVAPQEVQLFNSSYRDNLRMGRTRLSDETLTSMLKGLDLGDWLASLPAGLDSWPDESGSSLSGGQLRRFGLARALLHEAPIVILDEPTEGLDAATQQQVLAHIHACCARRTVIAITHRLDDLAWFDHYAIFSQGQVVESGLLNDTSSSHEKSQLKRLLGFLNV